MEIKVQKTQKNSNVFYQVDFGDTYQTLSSAFSVPIDYIKQFNPGALYKGKYLFLPGTNFKSYVVKPFDTLQKIAEENGVMVESIKQKNSLLSDYIFIGQKLYL